MTNERILSYLDNVIAAATTGSSLVADMDLAAFRADERTQLAVSMTVVIIGENCGRIAALVPDYLTLAPEIEWDKIRGLRNRSVHGYDQLNLDVVFEAARTDFPVLAAAARAVLQRLETEQP